MMQNGGSPPSKTRQLYDASTRTSTINLAEKVEIIDGSATRRLTDDELFDQVDTDKSGQISLDEFTKLITVMRTNMKRTHKQETEAEKAYRRTKMMRQMLKVSTLMCTVLLIGNMGLSYTVYVLGKDTSVGSHVHATIGATEMTDRDGRVVETGIAYKTIDYSTLQSIPDEESLARLHLLRTQTMTHLPDPRAFKSASAYDSAVESAQRDVTEKVVSYETFNVTDTTTKVLVVKTVSGAKYVVTDKQDGSDVDVTYASPVRRVLRGSYSQETRNTCASLGCDEDSCVIGVSEVEAIFEGTSVACHGHTLWEWPSLFNAPGGSATKQASFPPRVLPSNSLAYNNIVHPVDRNDAPSWLNTKEEEEEAISDKPSSNSARRLDVTTMARCRRKCGGQKSCTIKCWTSKRKVRQSC